MSRSLAILFTLALSAGITSAARKAAPTPEKDPDPMSATTFNGLEFRSIGPALASGRIGDIAVDPGNRARYFVAVASGGVWRTANNGTTWEPVFDDEVSYSIGCVTLDPNDPLTVWVGTGENNSQRSVSYGDGVYKSVDGGETWSHVGLEGSEHIGKILVDPRDSETVYVAAQGPLWNAGGDRGLYKTTDGGKTWSLVLEIDEHTGVSDIAFDPRDPDVLYAAAYQRRRRTWTLINGGPGSAIYKTEDGGATWNELERGLPKVDLGRIGLAVSPADPDVVYAIVEAEGDEGGFFRSVDAGSNWEKRNDYVSGSPQYYQEIVADPRDVDRVYSLDTWMMVTDDGGKTFAKLGGRYRHVDDHALWIDPENTDYLLVGCDGGVYESHDRGATWHFKANLPVTQFYRVTADNDAPFYNVYGGTQDNFTLGGPSRTTSANGITNADWYVTLGGDGFKTQVEPTDPAIVYSQYQYGALTRFDKRSGERIDIQPQPAPDEAPLRWNWDSALIISPHAPTRLYFAAQKVFRSDDRGNNWRAVSPDLTRDLDRNRLEVMGRVQRVDAVAKNASTSFYGNIVSLSESPLQEGLLYAGTDDGLVQVLEPESGGWRRIDRVRGVPEMSYVSDLEASLHDSNTVFAAFDNHKSGDFKPYLLRSSDRGRTWSSIAGDLPERGTVYTVAQDHVQPGLLFAGTESGVFFSVDGGGHWVRLEGGIPTIAVRDLEIQRRENDLVVGSFGRGILILDDYSALREVNRELLEREAHLFPVRRTWMYIPTVPLGLRGKSFQGDSFFTAPNPPFGAVFTYYLEDDLLGREEARRKKEKDAAERGESSEYPTWDELRLEHREEEPLIELTVSNEDGHVVRRLEGPGKAGFHRVAWDLRLPAPDPVRLEPREIGPFGSAPSGPLVLPGRYQVELARVVDGKRAPLSSPQTIETSVLGRPTLAAGDRAALLAFQRKTARLQRAVLGAVRAAEEAAGRIDHLQLAIRETPGASPDWSAQALALQDRLADLRLELVGDPLGRSRREPVPPSISDRVERIVEAQWRSTSAPTGTNRAAYDVAGAGFARVLEGLRGLIEGDLRRFEDALEQAGAPWTPGRIPRWSPE